MFWIRNLAGIIYGDARKAFNKNCLKEWRSHDKIRFGSRFAKGLAKELLGNGGLTEASLLVAGREHRLADAESLRTLLAAIQRQVEFAGH